MATWRRSPAAKVLAHVAGGVKRLQRVIGVGTRGMRPRRRKLAFNQGRLGDAIPLESGRPRRGRGLRCSSQVKCPRMPEALRQSAIEGSLRPCERALNKFWKEK